MLTPLERLERFALTAVPVMSAYRHLLYRVSIWNWNERPSAAWPAPRLAP